MGKPLCIDLFCGLGGWTEGFLAEGWDVVGFDIERHQYGDQRYPAQLVLQDVLTLHGRQFRNAHAIVASPPCQAYSWMAMPWSLAKREARWQRWERDSPFGNFHLNDLFDACFRIQREAIEATGKPCPACDGLGPQHHGHVCQRCNGSFCVTRHIPLVVENVKGAQPWVGPARAHFGSFYFWGDIERVGNSIVAGRLEFGKNLKPGAGVNKINGTGSWFYAKDNPDAFCWRKNGHTPPGLKVPSEHGRPSSRSKARKAASAQIARIPYALSNYVAKRLTATY